VSMRSVLVSVDVRIANVVQNGFLTLGLRILVEAQIQVFVNGDSALSVMVMQKKIVSVQVYSQSARLIAVI
jgi:hypothetical protein